MYIAQITIATPKGLIEPGKEVKGLGKEEIEEFLKKKYIKKAIDTKDEARADDLAETNAETAEDSSLPTTSNNLSVKEYLKQNSLSKDSFKKLIKDGFISVENNKVIEHY